MKNKSLVFQVWIVIAGIILGISMILSAVFPFALRSFFTEESYKTIEIAQARIVEEKINRNLMNDKEFDVDIYKELDIRDVVHIRYKPGEVSEIQKLKFEKLIANYNLSYKFLQELRRQIQSQKEDSKRYVKGIGKKKIFYVIRKFNYKGREEVVFSYMGDTYKNSLAAELLKKLMFITAIAIVISLFVAVGFAKYLIRPLIKLERNVRRIAKKEWNEPVNIDREDEIGSLSRSIEYMRRELKKRDEAQQSMLQNISHELKTPVMVIRSYSEAIEDGIFPKGDLKSTVNVINNEAKRLEKRISDLIYLSKLEYMSRHEITKESINLKSLIEDVMEKFKVADSKIKWKVQLDNININGIKEQWNVVIENLLDNAMRYAEKEIRISLYSQDKLTIICIHNDGEPIDENLVNNLFDKFKKGKKGKFGLGMSIVKTIVDFHNGKISVVNEDDGVSVYIKMENL